MRGSFYLVAQVRGEPALDLRPRHLLWPGVVLDLVAGDQINREVPGLRVAEVEAADGRRRPHGEALGQPDAGGLLDCQELPQRPLFGVIGTGRVACRRADAAILL